MLNVNSKAIVQSQKGMSLIEILIALTLLAVAGTFVTINVFDRFQEGNVLAAQTQIRNFGAILKDYKRKCNRYPTTDQGLDALLEKPSSGPECSRYPSNGFLESNQIPADPWDNPYEYSSENGRKYKIISYGSDGLEGGEEFEADINSEDL